MLKMPLQLNNFSFETPVGWLTVSDDGRAVKSLVFGKTAVTELPSELAMTASRQIEEYFSGRRKQFSVPVDPNGTEFQKKVLNAVMQIPFGSVRSYKDIAAAVGSERSFRAVGTALHFNPIPLLIPCHRVIRSDGTIGGYAGETGNTPVTGIKHFLLEMEEKYKDFKKVPF